MKWAMIAGLAAGAAMMVGGALAALSDTTAPPAESGTMEPMIAGQAMQADRSLLGNVSASPLHTVLAAALRTSGVAAALDGDGVFTLFAPVDSAMAHDAPARGRAQLARLMSYLMVPGRYDSQALLKAIEQGGGEARLTTVEGGTLVARLNGPTNIALTDARGDTADIAIYDVYARNGVMQVVDRMLAPEAAPRQMATN